MIILNRLLHTSVWNLQLDRDLPGRKIPVVCSAEVGTQTDPQIFADLSGEETANERVKKVLDNVCNIAPDQYGGASEQIKEGPEHAEKNVAVILEIYKLQAKLQELFAQSQKELDSCMEEADLATLQNSEFIKNYHTALRGIKETKQEIELFGQKMLDYGMENPWFQDVMLAAKTAFQGYDKKTEKRIESLQQELRSISNAAWNLQQLKCSTPEERLQLQSRVKRVVLEAKEIASAPLLETAHKVEKYALDVVRDTGGALVAPGEERKTSSAFIVSPGSAFKFVDKKLK